MAVRIIVDGVADAGLPADDPGFTLGLNVFETFRTYGLRPFRLEAHLERLARSAAYMDIPLPKPSLLRAEIEGMLAEDVWVRLTLTAGGHRVIQAAPIEQARVGGPVRLARSVWHGEGTIPGWVKHGNRAAWTLAARRAGADELLLVSPAGQILEASRSCVVAVVGDELHTPTLDGRILESVTRSALLDAAAEAGLPMRETALPTDAPFRELYVASTLKELAPVVALDGQPCAGSGPVGRALSDAFRQIVARECALTSAVRSPR